MEVTDEIGRLSAGFNDMASRLQALYADLESQVADRTAKLNESNSRLSQSEARTRAILDNTVDAIITIDNSGVVQSFNEGAEKLFGYAAEEVIGHKVNMPQPPDIAARHDEYFKRYLETGEEHIIGKGREERGKHKDGSVFPMYLAVSRVEINDTLLFTGIIRDITELRATEESLKASQRMYRSLAEAAPVGIFNTDPQGKCTYVNEQWIKISGLTEEQALGDGWSQTIHPDDRTKVWDRWNTTVESGIPFEMEYRFKRPDGKVAWVYGRSVAQKNAQGELLGMWEP